MFDFAVAQKVVVSENQTTPYQPQLMTVLATPLPV